MLQAVKYGREGAVDITQGIVSFAMDGDKPIYIKWDQWNIAEKICKGRVMEQLESLHGKTILPYRMPTTTENLYESLQSNDIVIKVPKTGCAMTRPKDLRLAIPEEMLNLHRYYDRLVTLYHAPPEAECVICNQVKRIINISHKSHILYVHIFKYMSIYIHIDYTCLRICSAKLVYPNSRCI